MTLFLHETKQNRLAFLIWTFSIALMLLICMMMFPEINTGMEDMNDMFANMGSFTQAFGMDRLNFGDVMGFYAIECGNILSIGGGFFAALLGINALAKEEKERTAEFLKYITPFAYAEAADIISESAVDMHLLALGLLYAAIGIGTAFLKYTRKDIAA